MSLVLFSLFLNVLHAAIVPTGSTSNAPVLPSAFVIARTLANEVHTLPRRVHNFDLSSSAIGFGMRNQLQPVGTELSLVGGFSPAQFFPNLFTKETFTSESVAYLSAPVSISIPRIADASILPFGRYAFNTQAHAYTGTKPLSLSVLDRVSLSLYCSFKKAATDPRCDYDTVAQGIVSSPLAQATTTPSVVVQVSSTPLTPTFATVIEKPVYVNRYITQVIEGKPGPAGTPGRDGKDGKDGTNGVDGKLVNSVSIPSGFGTYITPAPSPSYVAQSIGISTIGYLKDATIDTSLLNTPRISNAVFNGTSLFNDSASFLGNVSIANLVAASSTFTNAAFTNFQSTNATTTNAYITNLFTDAATSTDSYVTRLIAASSTLTDAVLTNSTTTNSYIANLVAASSTLADLVSTNAVFTNATATIAHFDALSVGTSSANSMVLTGTLDVTGTTTLATTTLTSLTATEATSTSLFSSLLTALTGFFTDLTTTNFTATNATTTNTITTNATTTNSYVANLFTDAATSTNSYISQLVAGSSTLSDALLTRSTSTDAYIARLVAASSTLQDLLATNITATNGTFTNATATNLVATNATSTSFFSTLLTAVTGLFTDLTTTNFTGTNATTTNLFTQNLAVGNASTTGNQSIDGMLAVTGTTTLGSNVYLNGNVVVGTSTNELFTINALVNSDIVPAQNKVYDLGSPSFYWRNAYADNITVNTLTAGSLSVGGTDANTFTLNTDNGTNDTEDINLVFFRGLVTPNAVIRWNSIAKRMESNMSWKIQNETPSVGTTTLTIQSGAGQGTSNLLELLNYSGNKLSVFNANGWLGIGSSTPGSALTVIGNASIGGNVTATGTLNISGTATLATTTATSLTANNATSTNQFILNLAAQNSTTTNSYITNLVADAASFTNTTLTNATATNLVATNATTTNFFTSAFSAISGFFTNLTATNATLTNATTTNAVTLNATSTNSYISQLVAGSSTLSDALLTRSTTTDAYIARLVAASSTLQDLLATNITATNGTVTNLGTTNLTATNASTTNGTVTNLWSTLANIVTGAFTNLTATNATTTNFFTSIFGANSGTFGTVTGGSITATSSLTSNGTLTVTGQTTLRDTALQSGSVFQLNNTTNDAAANIVNNGASGLSLLTFKTASADRMVIDNSGNVGIGTTNPTDKFVVWGGGTTIQSTTPGTGARLTLSDTNNQVSIESVPVGITTHLAFKAGGSERVRILDNGNVGIGTTNPFGRFTIQGASGSQALQYIWNSDFNGSSIGSGMYLGTGASSGNTYSAIEAFTAGDTAAGNLILNPSGGNVGVGTTTPLYKLDTWGTFRSHPGTDQNLDIISSLTVGSGVSVRSINDANTAYLPMEFNASSFDFQNGNVGIGTITPAYKLDVNSGSSRVATNDFGGITFEKQAYPNQGALLFSSDRSGYNFILGNKRQSDGDVSPIMTIVDTGNIGIGTTSPGAALAVNVGANATQMIGGQFISADVSTALSKIRFGGGNYNSGLAYRGGMEVRQTWNGSFTDTSIGFTTTKGGVGGGERLTIDGSGNVGIGTTTPPAKLSVTPYYSNIGTLTNAANTLMVGNSATLGTTAGSYLYPVEYQASAGNILRLQTSSYRRAAGSSWQGTGYRMQYAVDNSFTDGSKAYIEVGASDPSSSGGGFISLGTNGSDRLVVNNSGNIGIGTTTPQNKLSVVGSIEVNGNGAGVQLYNAARNAAGYLGTVSGWTGSGSNTDTALAANGSNLQFFTNNSVTPRITVDSSGNVGIAATNPTSKLTISRDTAAAAYQMEIRDTGGISDGQYTGIKFTQDAGGNTFLGGIKVPYHTTGATDMSFSTRNNADALFIKDGGNVGIGTVSPSASLTVNGPSAAVATSGSANGGTLRLTESPSSGAMMLLGTNGGNYGYLQMTNSADQTAHYPLALNPNGGSVGIGTTSPASKLDVNGDIRTNGLVLDQSRQIDDSILFSMQPYAEAGAFPYSILGGTAPTYTTFNTTDIPYSTAALANGYLEFIGDYVPVQPGERLYGEVYAMRQTGSSGSAGAFYMGVAQYDKDKHPVTANIGLDYFVAAGAGVPQNSTWNKYSGTITLATTHTPYAGSDGGPVRYVRPYVIVNYPSGTIPTYFAGAVIRRVTPFRGTGDMVFNGNTGVKTYGTVPKASLHIGDSTQSTSIPALGAISNTQFYLANSDPSYGLLAGTLSNGNSWMQVGRTDNTTTAYNLLLQPNGGNVGIGTTNPNYPLEVAASSGDTRSVGTVIGVAATYNPAAANTAAKVASGIRFNWYSDNWQIGAARSGGTAVDGLVFSRNGTEAVVIDSNRNVGIGTIAPTEKLEVSGGNILIDNTYSYSIKDESGIARSLLTTASDGSVRVNGYHGTNMFSGVNGATYFYPSGGVGTAVAALNGNGLTIDSLGALGPTSGVGLAVLTGKVGIGTTAPGGVLDIAAAAGSTFIALSDNTNSKKAYINYNNDQLQLYGNGPSAERVRFDLSGGNSFINSGNVGIGITNPQNKLQVLANSTYNNEGSAGLSLLSTGGDSELLFGADAANDFGYIQSMQDSTNWASRPLSLQPNGGKVGIGLTNPGEQLETSARVKFQGLYVGEWSSATRIEGTTGQLMGISAPAGQALQLQYNGGGVGIGTSNPAGYKLNVEGTAYYGGQVTINGFGNNVGLSFRDGFTPVNVGIQAKDIGGTGNRDGLELLGYNGLDFTVNNGANVAMHITGVSGGTMGNVGVGTVSPSFPLQIARDITYPNDITANGAQLALSNATSPNKRMTLGYDASSGNGYGFIAAGNNGVAWSNLNLQPTGGNVGIGTTNPTHQLQITKDFYVPHFGSFSPSGSVTDGGLIQVADYLSIGHRSYTNTPYIGFNARLTKSDVPNGINEFSASYTAAGSSMGIISSSGGNFDFSNYYNSTGSSAPVNESSFTNRFHIDVNGNVGVGTNNPQATLDVVTSSFPALRLQSTLNTYAPLAAEGNGLGIVTTAGAAQNVNAGGLSITSGYWTTPPTNGLYVQGNTGIGTTTPDAKLTVFDSSTGTGAAVFKVVTNYSYSGGATPNTVFRVTDQGAVFSDNGSTFGGGAADVAENYYAMEAVDAGTVVAFSTSTITINSLTGSNMAYATSTDDNYEVSGVRRAATSSEAIGVISTKAAVLISGTMNGGVPVALSGRVPVKITNENGDVHIGDYLTVSATRPGYAMKLTTNGRAIGRAISDYVPGKEKVMMYIENGYQHVDLASQSATSTMLTTGNLALDANGVAIVNIKSLASANGTWSIDENGRLTAKVLCLEDVCIDKTQLTNILNMTGQSGATSGSSGGMVAGTSTQSTSTTTDTASQSTATTTTDTSTTTTSDPSLITSQPWSDTSTSTSTTGDTGSTATATSTTDIAQTTATDTSSGTVDDPAVSASTTTP